MKEDFAGGPGKTEFASVTPETRAAFLMDRRQAVALTPAGRKRGLAYVWRRVFLKGKEERR